MSCNDANSTEQDAARRGSVKRVTSQGDSIEYDQNAIKAALQQILNRDRIRQATGRVRPGMVRMGTRWIK